MNNTLLKKTRSQLVEIIIRKDDIEKKRSLELKAVSSKLKDTQSIVDELNEIIKKKDLEIIHLTTDNGDFRDLIDNYTTQLIELKSKHKKFNIACFIVIIILIIMLNIIIWL